MSGKSREERAELRRMIEYVSDGDRLRVASMDRLARSSPDLLDLVRELTPPYRALNREGHYAAPAA